MLAEARLSAYAKELGEEPEIVARYKGADLLGTRYAPPFPYFVGHENAHRVLAADYVTTEDGTGIVHIAPAYGEEDKAVTDAAGITPVTPVDSKGRFTRRCRTTRGRTSSRPTPTSSGTSKTARVRRASRVRSCCATRRTSTPIRIAGVAATR